MELLASSNSNKKKKKLKCRITYTKIPITHSLYIKSENRFHIQRTGYNECIMNPDSSKSCDSY